MLREKYIEVWNKVDLITESHQEECFQQRVEQAAEQEDHDVVLMSCTQGFNKDLFLEKLGDMSASLKGKQLYKLEYLSYEHGERFKWLRQHAHLSSDISEAMEVSSDGSTIILQVLLDDVVFNRYLKEFEPEIFSEKREKSRRAPEGW